MHEPEYLQTALGFGSLKKIGAEITTTQGRVDFIYETEENNVLVIELETEISSESKYHHCFDQLLRYKRLENKFNGKKVEVILLFANEGTTPKFRALLVENAKDHDFLLRQYSLIEIKRLFYSTMNRLNRTSGLTLSKSVALGVSSLKWLNKFMVPFLTSISPKIRWNELKVYFNSTTNFYVLKRLAEDFELISKCRLKGETFVGLTDYGERFRDEVLQAEMLNNIIIRDNTIYQKDNNTPDYILDILSLEQKRILLDILLNGNFTKLKTNIFYFLRFIHLTEGEWMPKISTKMSASQKLYINNILNSSYSPRTLKELLQQLCNYCEELELVERIPNRNCHYDKVILTSLGSRVIGYFELYLHLKREQLQIPLQIT